MYYTVSLSASLSTHSVFYFDLLNKPENARKSALANAILKSDELISHSGQPEHFERLKNYANVSISHCTCRMAEVLLIKATTVNTLSSLSL